MGHNEKHESLRFGRVWWQKHRSEGQRLTQNLRDLTDHLQRRVTYGIWLESKRSAVLASRAHSMIVDSRDQQQQFLMQLASMESQIGFVLQRLSMRDSPQEAGVVEEVLESELDDDLPIYSLNDENLPNTRPAEDDDVHKVDGEEEKGWLLNVACPRETNLALGSTSRQPQRADDLDPIMNGSSSHSSSSTVYQSLASVPVTPRSSTGSSGRDSQVTSTCTSPAYDRRVKGSAASGPASSCRSLAMRPAG